MRFKTHIRTWAVGHASVSLGKQFYFVLIKFAAVSMPDIIPDPAKFFGIVPGGNQNGSAIFNILFIFR